MNKIKERIKNFLSNDLSEAAFQGFGEVLFNLDSQSMKLLGEYIKKGFLTVTEKAELGELLTLIKDNSAELAGEHFEEVT